MLYDKFFVQLIYTLFTNNSLIYNTFFTKKKAVLNDAPPIVLCLAQQLVLGGPIIILTPLLRGPSRCRGALSPPSSNFSLWSYSYLIEGGTEGGFFSWPNLCRESVVAQHLFKLPKMIIKIIFFK